MASTVVGLFDDRSTAEQVRTDLIGAGFDRDDVNLMQQDGGASSSTTRSGAAGEDKGFWDSLKELFTGDDDYRRAGRNYEEGVRRGGVLVTVRAATDDRADVAAEILHRYGAVDVDERSATWASEGSSTAQGTPALGRSDRTVGASTSTGADLTGRDDAAGGDTSRATATGRSAATTDRAAIPVVQEEIAIGKRQVQRGAVRIVRHVTETPVEQNVELREEHVNVERRPVDRPLTDADRDAFSDKEIEVTETAEEAVAQKRARVVEEVVLDKNADSRTETVRDTVRKTDVQVERIPGQDASERVEKTNETTGAPDVNRSKVNP